LSGHCSEKPRIKMPVGKKAKAGEERRMKKKSRREFRFGIFQLKAQNVKKGLTPRIQGRDGLWEDNGIQGGGDNKGGRDRRNWLWELKWNKKAKRDHREDLVSDFQDERPKKIIPKELGEGRG